MPRCGQQGGWLGILEVDMGCASPTLGILVKVGPATQTRREVAAIDFIRHKCPQIPVPEILGTWELAQADGTKAGYIAMSVLPGSILRDAWPTMSDSDKETALGDLKTTLTWLRCIPVPEGAMIGAVNGMGLAADLRNGDTEFGGPFRAESDFNEWLISLIHPDSHRFFASFFVDTIRSSLASLCSHQIRFTHGDLGMHNILVEGGRITGIIDWEYAGWYPEYWEYIKMI